MYCIYLPRSLHAAAKGYDLIIIVKVQKMVLRLTFFMEGQWT